MWAAENVAIIILTLYASTSGSYDDRPYERKPHYMQPTQNIAGIYVKGTYKNSNKYSKKESYINVL